MKNKKIAEIFVILSDDKNRRNYNFFLEYLKSVNSKAIFDNSLNYEELLKNNTEYDEYEDEYSYEENYKTYYEILGVDQDATKIEIKTAFRNLAKDYHPDSSNNSNTEEKFKEINEAYHILNDEESRKNYDCYLEHFQEEEEFDDRWDYSSLLDEDYLEEEDSEEEDYLDENNWEELCEEYEKKKHPFVTHWYYETLEVDYNASKSEIYIAFEDRKQETVDAYQTLSKKWKRKKYDLSLEYSQISTPKKFTLYHYLIVFIIGISVVGYIIWRLI